MSLVIEYRESSPRIKITDVAAAVPEASLRVLRWHRTGENRLRLFLLAEGEGFDTLEGELAAQSNVTEVTVITEEQDARLYQVTLVATVDHLPRDARVDGVISDVRIEPDGLYVTGYISGRAALFEIREFLAERGIDMQVERLHEAADERSDGVLTDEQLEALVVAYEMGYFSVPRAATQSDVAAELGISAASLSERLKRGQERLIERHLDERRVVTTRD